MRYSILQLLICTSIAFLTQTVSADDLQELDLKEAEMNLLKEEESFLTEIFDEEKESNSTNNITSEIKNKNQEIKEVEEAKIVADIKDYAEDSVKVNENLIKKEVSIDVVATPVPSSFVSKELVQKEKDFKRASSENVTLKRKLADAQNKIKTLQAQLAEMRDSLFLAETEVERLGNIAKNDCRNVSITNPSYKPSTGNSIYANRNSVRNITQQRDPLLSKQQDQKANDEMPIATVVVDKANLRAGPGTNNSPIMTIGKGTRLAIETRQGDWYRVVAPTGERAWISRDTIAFGRDPRSSPSRTVKVQSVNRNEEERAMELIRKR